MAIPTIPDSHKVLFEKPVLASLATHMPSGMIQVNPVWCDYDGIYVRFNSAQGRQKDKNVKRNSAATVLLVDPEDVYFWVEVRGRVVEITEEGANEHINDLSWKYENKDYTGYREGQIRLIYKIQPERIRVNTE